MNKPLYILAPIIAIIAALIGFAVVPFGPVGAGQSSISRSPRASTSASSYIFAVGSLAVYGVILAGWASNNKYSFIGGYALERPVDQLRDPARAVDHGHRALGMGSLD